MTVAHYLEKIKDLVSVPQNNPELLKAQYRAFAYQMPLMYVILLINTWAVAVTHMGVAPRWMTIYIPALMTLVCVVRLLTWLRSMRREPTHEIAFNALTRTNRISGVIAITFTLWAFGLFPYGDAYAKAHVAFYMAITVIGVIFCLMHLRPAAFTVAVIVNGAFAIFFALSGNVVFVAIAINTALVSAAMLVILQIHYRDFTRMVDAQAENFRLANIDSLTELPNRRAFFSHLNRAYATARVQAGRLAVGVIDLDGFKPVNDIHGHAVGDKLLYEVGRRLSSLCPDNVHLARLGGDEFSLIVSDLGNEADLLALGEQICLGLRQPIVLGDTTVQIGGSLGFAVYPEMASDAADLFENADYALYHGKRTQRGHAILFSADHDAEIHRDSRIEQALHMADFERELTVVFQPVVDISSQTTVSFEALARWTNPVLGAVSPTQFIPVAERAGIISRLTRSLLQKALATATLWPSDIRLSFNLSAHDLSSPESIQDVIGVIFKSGFDATRLDFEITETAFIHDLGQVQTSAETLRMLGCGISLDDFGTGYSSLLLLHALPLTKIKIDRSFVTDLHKTPARYKIVKSLLALSRDMGLDCIVEGVETQEEFTAIKTLGGSMVQGYFYTRPIPSIEIAGFLGQPVIDTVE